MVKGPKFYKPYSVSFNNKDNGKTVINKYAKGLNKFKFFNQVESSSNNESEEKSNSNEWENDVDMDIDNYESAEPTNYQQKQNKLATNWKIILDDIYCLMLENEAILDDTTCFNCNDVATLKCIDCGPNIFYCDNCFNHFHSKINLFHSSVNLKNFQFRSNEIKLPQLCKERCEHSIKRILTVHLKGKGIIIYSK